jgi:hypothetical protein
MKHLFHSLKQEERPCITFHVARDPEFLQGIQDGRQLLPPTSELTGPAGWWDVESLLQFIRAELSPQRQARENEVQACLDAPPHTPIYNLGIVAGFLSVFAEAAQTAAHATR